jgi:molybdopterin converting factor subunit 1
MHTVRLLFFATLRDKAGMKASEIKIPDEMTVLELKDRIAREFPGLKKSMATVVIAVNREFAFDEATIPDHAEVALFPPVSGGNHFPRS